MINNLQTSANLKE